MMTYAKTLREKAILRPLHPTDVQPALRLAEHEGWNQTELDWARFLKLPPRRALAIVANGWLVATATTALFGTVGWIGMVLVKPEFRGQGFGRAIVWEAIRELLWAGARTVKLDATPSGKPLYLKLGFVPTFELVRYRGVGMLAPFERVVPIGNDLSMLARVRILDRTAYGVDRSPLLYALARDFPELAAYYEGAAGEGYLLGRRGRHFTLLGPLVATTPAAARNLFAWALSTLAGKPVAFDCPAPNQHASALAVQHGFSVSRSFTRMYFGLEPFEEQTELIYATSGAEKG